MRRLLMALAVTSVACVDLDALGYCDNHAAECVDGGATDALDTGVDTATDSAADVVSTDVPDVRVDAPDSDGSCTGECVPGATMGSTAACPLFFDVPSRLCNTKCTWEEVCTTPSGWHPIAAAPTALVGRHYHGAVWTGAKMIVWGGAAGSVLADGAIYDISANSWKMIGTPPSAFADGRFSPLVAWTGSQMIVFGGNDSSSVPRKEAASYTPTSDTWKMLNPTPLLTRSEFAGVWSTTTNELLLWGGTAPGCSASGDCSDGASYNPATDTWTALPVAPIGGRRRHSAVWTGTAMLVWGGRSDATGALLNDGALYNPSTKTWSILPAVPAGFDARYGHAAMMLGTSFLVFGGVGGPSVDYESSGAIFQIGGSWKAIATPTAAELAPPARSGVAAWTGAGRFWIWGGIVPGTTTFSSAGASFDPVAGTWKAMDSSTSPAARHETTVVNVGKAAVVWGGQGVSTFFNDGSAFAP